MTELEPPVCSPVCSYFCFLCNVRHFEDTDATFYKLHFSRKWRQTFEISRETIEQRGRRYRIPYYLERSVGE